MKLFQFISNLLSSNPYKDPVLPIPQKAKEDNRQTRLEELGVFSYNETGFEVNLSTELSSIRWADIERVQAYKADLLTTDEICMDITFNNQWIMITEATAGWYQFIDRLNGTLPIKENWEADVLRSPFEYDLTTIYERSDRKMPGQSNFYSIIEGKTIEEVINIFKKNGWKIHTSSLENCKMENSWSDLVLNKESDGNNLLVNGLVAYHEDNLEALEIIYNELTCPYKFEIYGEQNTVLLEKKNGM